jgi:hypothetical protein
VLGQAPQDVHHLGLEAHRAGGPAHAVEGRFDVELANVEAVRHALRLRPGGILQERSAVAQRSPGLAARWKALNRW